MPASRTDGMGRAALIDEVERLEKELRDMRARKDAAYEERNRLVRLVCVLALANGWKAGFGEHKDVPGEDWDSEWRTVVFIDLPSGQVSWHIHDSHRDLFVGLPRYDGEWDGHDTETKYERVARVLPSF